MTDYLSRKSLDIPQIMHIQQQLMIIEAATNITGSSPDSEMYSMESDFTLFSSSASASIERCSSASDLFDHESLVSDTSLHFSGGFRGSSLRGLDPDPNKNSTVRKNGGPYLLGKKVEKVDEIDGRNQTLSSARSSFSHYNKECQNWKSGSEILLRSDRRRPASLDLNNQTLSITSSSPRLGVPMKSSVSAQKGWSSERVPLHRNANRKQGSFTSMPINNGRILPSKWEDAERWIIGPVAGNGALKPSAQLLQRRPKAKSGPLGPPGSACHSICSPAMPSFGGNGKSFATELPLIDGVGRDNNSSVQYQEGIESNESYPQHTDSCVGRSISMHGCPELPSQSLLQITQDDKIGGLINATSSDSRGVSRRDMATQMSPEDSPYSSPKRTTSSPLSLYTLVIREMQHSHFSQSDIRDVEVDDQVTLTQCSMKSRSRIPGRGSDTMDEWKNEIMEVSSTDREASEMINVISKVKREEAKITAWENLQKAKAEAAIRKLEMKLEKKRSSSMDRIMYKLRSAQKKAQEKRESVLSNESHQAAATPSARSSHKAISVFKTSQIRSLSGCFTCPAF